jgi:hypothetical protein
MKDLETIDCHTHSAHSTQQRRAESTADRGTAHSSAEHSRQQTAGTVGQREGIGHREQAQVALTVVLMSLLSPLTATGVYCTAKTESIPSFYVRLAGFLDVS